MGTYKAVSEVVAALQKRYDGPTDEINGFTYIPWQESAKKLDEVFGPFGYDIIPVASESHPREGIYTASVMVIGRALDDETGQLVTLTRGGFGRSSAMASKKEQEEEGLAVTRNLKLHDTAAAAAASDALSRACKLLGDGFGRYLYDEKGGKTTTSGTRGGAGGGPRPSDKQMGVLRKNGYSDEQVAGMDFKTWKGVLDAIFGGETPAVAPATKKPVAAGAREEEFPF